MVLRLLGIYVSMQIAFGSLSGFNDVLGAPLYFQLRGICGYLDGAAWPSDR